MGGQSEETGCQEGLPPPDVCTCTVLLILSGAAAGLLALGISGGRQPPHPIACNVTAVIVGGCRYECNCQWTCGALRVPCDEHGSRSDTRRRYYVCESCAGHKYLYVAQTSECATTGYAGFSALLDQRANAMQVTGGEATLDGIEPGLLDYRQSEDPTTWQCIPEPEHSEGESVAGCQMRSCDDGQFCKDGGYCPEGSGAKVIFAVFGGLLASAVMLVLACVAKWQLLSVCGRLPPEARGLEVVPPAEAAVL